MSVLVSATPAVAASPDRPPDALVRLFPEGLPRDAAWLDRDTVVIGSGTVLIDIVPSAATDGVCNAGNVCIWEHAQYEGVRMTTSTCGGPCSWVNLALWSFNDVMSSWKNRLTVDVKWAFNAGGGGTLRCMNAGSQNPVLSGSNNDEASSVKVFASATAC
jgi:Peptidase inhibitor family I36